MGELDAVCRKSFGEAKRRRTKGHCPSGRFNRQGSTFRRTRNGPDEEVAMLRRQELASLAAISMGAGLLVGSIGFASSASASNMGGGGDTTTNCSTTTSLAAS